MEMRVEDTSRFAHIAAGIALILRDHGITDMPPLVKDLTSYVIDVLPTQDRTRAETEVWRDGYRCGARDMRDIG